MTAIEFLEYQYGITLTEEKALIHPQMLLKAMEEYASQSKWVSVEEPPEFGETVLVYCKIYGRFLATYEYIGEFGGEKYGNWRDFKGNLGILPPVWWMKIDEPPVEKS